MESVVKGTSKFRPIYFFFIIIFLAFRSKGWISILGGGGETIYKRVSVKRATKEGTCKLKGIKEGHKYRSGLSVRERPKHDAFSRFDFQYRERGLRESCTFYEFG